MLSFAVLSGLVIRQEFLLLKSGSRITAVILSASVRMAVLGAAVAAALSALLIFFNRRIILSPIKGLTETAKQITRGNFVLFEQRGTHCREILGCKKTACPSYNDNSIPCWLMSGTLCERGKPVGEFALKLGSCLKCVVYKDLKGDEIRQLIDNFNRMTLTIKENREEMMSHAEEMENSYLQTVMALTNAMEAIDPDTKGHSLRVAELSDKIAVALNFSELERKQLKFAALLHDVGKIGIDSRILLKPGRLNGREKREIMTHPEKGVKLLEPVDFLKPVLGAIRHHHERLDGSGYPYGIRGEEIPFQARIISVADTWDAMLSNRHYRKALSSVYAMAEIERLSGIHFDPAVVNEFIRNGHAEIARMERS